MCVAPTGRRSQSGGSPTTRGSGRRRSQFLRTGVFPWKKSPGRLRNRLRKFGAGSRHTTDKAFEGLIRKKPGTSNTRATKVELRRRRILEILHGRPRAYGINRSNWSLRALAVAYTREHGDPISRSTASRLVRDSGYVMKKVRRVLSSPDLRYREKVDLLLRTLHNLGPRDFFFFVDELGPLRVKKYGGVRSRWQEP